MPGVEGLPDSARGVQRRYVLPTGTETGAEDLSLM